MNTNDYTEEELLDLIRKGDHAAFREVHKRYHGALMAIAFNKLQDIPRSKDAVQDVFIYLWENRNKLTVVTLENYLATAIKYHCLKIIGRTDRMTFPAQIPSEKELADYDNDLSSMRSLEEILLEEMDRLPRQCKIVFILSRQEGMRIEEIAQKLKISQSAVKNQLNKALGRLRNRLKINIFFFLKKIFFFRGGPNAFFWYLLEEAYYEYSSCPYFNSHQKVYVWQCI